LAPKQSVEDLIAIPIDDEVDSISVRRRSPTQGDAGFEQYAHRAAIEDAQA
jgi:hypothetical protein